MKYFFICYQLTVANSAVYFAQSLNCLANHCGSGEKQFSLEKVVFFFVFRAYNARTLGIFGLP